MHARLRSFGTPLVANFPTVQAFSSVHLLSACAALALCACGANETSGSGRRAPENPGIASAAGGQMGSGSTSAGGSAPMGSSSVPVPPGSPASSLPPFAGFDCAAKATPIAAPRRLWRLNPTEYANTVATALNGRRAGTQAMPAPPSAFTNPLQQADTRYTTESGLTTVSDAEFRASWTSSEELASQLVQSVKAGTCWAADSSADPGFSTCAGTLIGDRGAILFRRPLPADEVAHYVQIAKDGLAELGADGALALAFQSMLLAPEFVFKPEIGAATAAPSVFQLTPHEVGSLLAYTLTQGPPDTELWDAANGGMLTSPEQIKAQVVRLMGGVAANGARNFVTEYFELPGILSVAKTADMGGPAPCHYNKGRLVSQAEALVGDVYKTSANSGFFKALFTTAEAYADCSSESILGVTGTPPDTGAPAKVLPPAGQRAGFLTNPAWLGQMASRDDTKPVRRGRFVNVDVLCRDIPPVPIQGVPPLGETTTLTNRERLAVHASFNSSCMPCHSLLDGPGLAFENYDTLGAYRTMDKNKPIDASGMLVGVDDASVSFTDGADLSTQLAGTNRVQECVMRNGFRYFLGRSETQADQCSLKQAKDAYTPAGSYVDFISALVTSDSFLKRSF